MLEMFATKTRSMYYSLCLRVFVAYENMEFAELIKQRQSVRKYQAKPVEREKLQMLIESVRLAPSASNSQPWKLLIVDDPELKDRVARATFSKTVAFNQFAPQAPVIAVLTIEKPRLITQIGGWIKKREFSLIDLGIAAAHLCLQAAELDLGTCMLGWFDEQAIKELLHIPRQTRIGLVITLGYAAEEYPLRPKIRKEVAAMSSFNGYSTDSTLKDIGIGSPISPTAPLMYPGQACL